MLWQQHCQGWRGSNTGKAYGRMQHISRTQWPSQWQTSKKESHLWWRVVQHRPWHEPHIVDKEANCTVWTSGSTNEKAANERDATRSANQRPGSPDPQRFPEGSDPILLLAQYMSWAHEDIFLNSSGTKHHLNWLPEGLLINASCRDPGMPRTIQNQQAVWALSRNSIRMWRKIPCLDNKLTIDIKMRKLLKQVFTYWLNHWMNCTVTRICMYSFGALENV